ncbi:hypothetical protein OIU74_009606 [Salix koriyanagi]|uniref:Uncharacterized protein n=1 Tax=Salix koriyanagi TaxID=2511006 RepID=A0A9Q0TSQ1_9ROSI|nr:hypothetical protein OIU74_009606 [Salix koriyanagi]
MEEFKAVLEKRILEAQQEMKLPNAPLIIATKGPSLSSTSRIARELADAYKHPLIDEDDITKALESIRPASSSRTKISDEHFRQLTFRSFIPFSFCPAQSADLGDRQYSTL